MTKPTMCASLPAYMFVPSLVDSNTRALQASEIKVGKRSRTTLGDIDLLAHSLRQVGILKPILVTEDNHLVSGLRRVVAGEMNHPGQTYECVVVGDFEEARSFMLAEDDVCREPMKPSEVVHMARLLKALLAAKPLGGNTLDRISEVVGHGANWIDEAMRVVELAEAGNPVATRAMELMDAHDGSVHAAWRMVEGIRQERPKKPFVVTTPRHRQMAEKQQARLWSVLGTLDGIDTGLADFDFEKALALTTPEERDQMVDTLRAARRALNDARKIIEQHEQEEK